MKRPTYEQIEEFWEWCGLELLKASDGNYRWFSLASEVNQSYDIVSPVDSETNLPIVDLNNLFKYAVPKLKVKGQPIAIVEKFLQSIGHDLFFSEDPALALFWAIRQVKEVRDEEPIQD